MCRVVDRRLDGISEGVNHRLPDHRRHAEIVGGVKVSHFVKDEVVFRARRQQPVGRRGAASPRQQTLRATIDWSVLLLTDAERALFQRLAEFVSGWTLEAVEVICLTPPLDTVDGFELLRQSARKSLIIAQPTAAGVRYRCLETVRHHALKRLQASGELPDLRDRHLDFYTIHAVQWPRRSFEPQVHRHLEAIATDYGNYRAALNWVGPSTNL